MQTSTDPIAGGYDQPSVEGRFGAFGGSYVAETLVAALTTLRDSYMRFRTDAGFQEQFHAILKEYVGRPSPIYYARRLTEAYGGAHIYLKREDLNHTGAHKINNAVGQILLAQNLQKTRIIAETGAGQHGVATATVCARAGLPCAVYMGEEDIARQKPNVERMQLLGAEIKPVSSGSRTLKDALNEALRDWVTNVEDTFYVIGSVAGPHPYPMIVRDFNSVIGSECYTQMPAAAGRQPDMVIACVGGGSNAMGIFYRYLNDAAVTLLGVEAGGRSMNNGEHAATLTTGRPGVLHGSYSYLIQDDDGQVCMTDSISAGLDYPGVGPEHAYLKESGRAQYISAGDEQVLDAFTDLCRLEGIIPALESAHALAAAKQQAPRLGKDKIILVNLSGRGDKDLQSVLARLGG